MTKRAPTWLTIVAVLLVLWGLMGCASFWMHLSFADRLDTAPAADRQLYASLPQWLNIVYATGVGTGLLGSVALLAKSRWAVPLYAVSLVAVIVQFGWTFAMTEIIALKGAAATIPFPVIIVAIAVAQVWLSRRALARGWIG
jgi:hypothetical protein